MTWGSTTLPEWAFTIVALLGIALTLVATLSAYKTMNYLDAMIRANQHSLIGLRAHVADRLIAKANIYDELSRMLMHAIAAAIGIVALATPPANTEHAVTPLSLILSGGLIANSVILVAVTWQHMRVREQAIGLIIRQTTEDEHGRIDRMKSGEDPPIEPPSVVPLNRIREDDST